LIQISPSVSVPKPPLARPALLASGGTQAFAGALKTALAPGAAAEAEGETPVLELCVRQNLAGDGKALPDAPEGDAEDKTADETPDIAFAWFGTALVLPQPAPALPRLPVSPGEIRLAVGEKPALMAPPELRGSPLVTSRLADPAPLGSGPDTHEGVTGDIALPPPVSPASIQAARPAAPEIDPPAVLAPATLALGTIKPPTGDIGATPPVDRAAGPIRIDLPPAQDTAIRTQPIALASIQPRAEAVQLLVAPLAAAASPCCYDEPIAPRPPVAAHRA